MSRPIEAQAVVVTGGSSGIGEAVVREFAARGAAVAIVSDQEERGSAIARELGQRVVHLTADLASLESIRGLPSRVEEALGNTADVLVNNAGIYRQGDAGTTGEEEWRLVLAVNLDAAFYASKAFLPHLRKNGGVIVNVASEAGLRAIRNQVAYNVSKAGMIALTKSLAVDLAPLQVRANAVCPGTTRTPLVEKVLRTAADPAATLRTLEGVRPANRLGDPAEIARAVVFLASPDVGYATGAVLSVDGGFTA